GRLLLGLAHAGEDVVLQLADLLASVGALDAQGFILLLGDDVLHLLVPLLELAQRRLQRDFFFVGVDLELLELILGGLENLLGAGHGGLVALEETRALLDARHQVLGIAAKAMNLAKNRAWYGHGALQMSAL